MKYKVLLSFEHEILVTVNMKYKIGFEHEIQVTDRL